MDILRIIKAERKTDGNPFVGPGRKELVLIIYDTDGVQRIRDREDMQWTATHAPEHVIEVKKKYALVLVGRDDSDMIAQCYATRQRASEAEWCDDWLNLPAAIERLRARNEGKEFPDEIDHVIDWPYRRGRPRPESHPLSEAENS